jgi:ABC-2 type transport system permease protein
MISSWNFIAIKEPAMARIRDVIDFEVTRNLKKRTFWFASLFPPILILIIIAISHASSNSANNASVQQAINTVKNSKIAVLDETGLVNRQLLTKEHIESAPSKQSAITAIENGSITAFIYYPANVSTYGIQIYAQDKGLTNATPYNSLATSLLNTSVIASARTAIHNTELVKILQKTPSITNTTYKNGKKTNNEAYLIAPSIFLVAFLAIIVLQSYIMISSTTEEKENRAAEILLTSIKSSRLLTGKILSLFTLGLVQLLVIVVPLIVAYALFRHHITLPGDVSLSQIPLDTKAIIFGLLFFVGGVVLFTGVMVGFGSLFPSVQEGGRFVGLAIIFAMLPVYAIGYILSSTHALVVNVFTYFPLTAPTTVLIRNALGNISVSQALTSLFIVIISATFAIMFAMRAFRYSAMEYGRRVSFKEVLK